jgi:hypothetical protein
MPFLQVVADELKMQKSVQPFKGLSFRDSRGCFAKSLAARIPFQLLKDEIGRTPASLCGAIKESPPCLKMKSIFKSGRNNTVKADNASTLMFQGSR